MAVSLRYRSFMIKLLAVSVLLPSLVFRTKVLIDGNPGRAENPYKPSFMNREAKSKTCESLQHFAAAVQKNAAANAGG